MKISAMMREAYKLIDCPEKWTQGAFSRDVFGNSRPSDSEDSVCFCTLGAINRTCRADTNNFGNANMMIHKLLVEAIQGRSISLFNDRKTWEEVSAMWWNAIRKQEATELMYEPIEEM